MDFRSSEIDLHGCNLRGKKVKSHLVLFFFLQVFQVVFNFFFFFLGGGRLSVCGKDSLPFD